MSTRQEMVRAIAEAHRHERGALMPILHEVNDELGHIDDADVTTIADVLNLSRADVHGVRSFYDDFRTTPPATHQVRLCRAEACQSVGAEQLFAPEVAASLGADVDVHQVFCLGNCALGPSAMIDGQLHGRLSPARLAEVTAGWRS